jgi:hypothetical protein
VADGRVDHDRPERRESDPGREAHPLDDGARDERHGDDGEGRLIGEEEEVRNRSPRFEPDAREPEVVEAAEQRPARGEGQAVAGRGPRQAGGGERSEAHHHRVQGVLRARQAAIEEGEAGGHQQHERGRDQHPGGIGGGSSGHERPLYSLLELFRQYLD